MSHIDKYREGLVCLVPRPGVGGITCHEKTLCDCQVLEIFAYHDAYRDRCEMMAATLKRIYDTETKPGGRHRHDEDADDVAAEALSDYENFKRGQK